MKHKESAKKKLKKRPIKVVYPYMCPFCEELAYPDSSEVKPLRLPDSTYQTFKCMGGHLFYVFEKVVQDQSWAEDKCKQPKLIQKSRSWKRQLREHNYGVDDLPD